jgi:hypothetical protein
VKLGVQEFCRPAKFALVVVEGMVAIPGSHVNMAQRNVLVGTQDQFQPAAGWRIVFKDGFMADGAMVLRDDPGEGYRKVR